MSLWAGVNERFEQPLSITPQDLLESLWQRKFAIALVTFIAGGIAFQVAKIMPPSYTAEGLLVVDTQQLNIPELQTVTSGRTVEPWGGRSEARVLTSRELIEKVVTKLALDEDPQFNPTLKGSWREFVTTRAWLPGAVREALADALEPSHPPKFGDEIRSEVVDNVRSSLMAFSEERSYAIELAYTGTDPVKSADIVNTLMQLYIAEQVKQRQSATVVASEGLKQRLEELQVELEAAQARVRATEGDVKLVQTQMGTVTSQHLSELINQRQRIRVERDRAEADRAQLVGSLANATVSALGQDLITPRLQSLWTDEAALRRRLAEESIELGERHPRLIGFRTQIASIQEQVRDEVQAIVRNLDRRIASLRSQAEDLTTQIMVAEIEAAEAAQERSTLSQLQADVQAKQELYSLYRTRYEQTLAATNRTDSDIRIVSVAAPPAKPSSPGAKPLAMAGAFSGFLLGCAGVVSRRWLSTGIETLDEAGRLTGLPALGAIPSVKAWLKPNRRLGAYVTQYPNSSVTETLRGILLRLSLVTPGREPSKVLLVTSSEPAEGKTSFALAFAQAAALDGLRCLAIECDFRRPSFAIATNLAPFARLNDYLSGGLDWCQDAIVEDPATGLHMLMARATMIGQRDLVTSDRLRVMLGEARQHYDLIVIDSPPVMKVPDAIQLADAADSVIFMTCWRRTRRKVVAEAVRRIELAGRPIAGIVLSRVGGPVPEEYVYGGYAA